MGSCKSRKKENTPNFASHIPMKCVVSVACLSADAVQSFFWSLNFIREHFFYLILTFLSMIMQSHEHIFGNLTVVFLFSVNPHQMRINSWQCLPFLHPCGSALLFPLSVGLLFWLTAVLIWQQFNLLSLSQVKNINYQLGFRYFLWILNDSQYVF